MSRASRDKKAGQDRKKGGSQGQNRKAAEDFLEKNRKREGVFETDSGLQYQIIEDVKGPSPFITDKVQVHQRIQLLNGTFLEDTYQSGMPESFPLSAGIKGYQEGLMMMGVGSRYKFFIPPELAWGKKGAGKRIGPYSLLTIDVRLEKIL